MQSIKSSECVIFKDLRCNNYAFSALLVIGCDLCLIRYDVLMMLGEIALFGEKHELKGIGNSILHTLGSFEIKLEVDEVELVVVLHVARERDIA